MWPGLIAKSKDGGADVIQTYVFWNGHEPTRGQVLFTLWVPQIAFLYDDLGLAYSYIGFFISSITSKEDMIL